MPAGCALTARAKAPGEDPSCTRSRRPSNSACSSALSRRAVPRPPLTCVQRESSPNAKETVAMARRAVGDSN